MVHHRCLAVCIALVTITISDIAAIKCWRCSSTDSDFCGDVLDHRNFTAEQLQWHLTRCSPVLKKFDYKGDKMIAKCSVRIDLVNEKLVYSRKCVEEAENANSNSCLTDEWFNDSDNKNVQLMTCETCAEADGCNSHIKNYFGTDTDSSVGNNAGLMNVSIQPIVAACVFTNLIYAHCQ